ncbi:acyl-CoA synthetase [Williamsia maris]|uniref:Fatty-acyl-CoA synthase n=1 Tax=Williamsia maris TaxID=72806 RepID=A0ABT1HHK6_9NOCA|nr:acyl-CoA synthetase [Williamsia maris]MCP2177664.1 fatty-acyl-CoA synthase [Williamsia maris]
MADESAPDAATPETPLGGWTNNPVTWAASDPDRVAVVMAGSGVTTTYAELADRAVRLANLFTSYGLQRGDVVAMLSENSHRFHEVFWACRLGGFYFTPVNRHLTAHEIAYIVNDCAAQVLVASANLDASSQLTDDLVPTVTHRLAQFGAIDGYRDYDTELASADTTIPTATGEGDLLQYSSGTTGRPKGIRRPLADDPVPAEADPLVLFLRGIGAQEGTVYLSPAPLYHSAPIGWSMGALRLGGTVVVMERFDPVEALRAIETYKVQTGQFVPTMFVRMLKLPEQQRLSFDVSSLAGVVHAAAPCPIEVKRAMIDWWGPIVFEYWSSSELAGFTFIGADDWLAHPGSVGKSLIGTLHICDDEGVELPVGEVGAIWAENSPPFSYLGDQTKEQETTNSDGWRSVGDVGRLDADGYLYLTDRSSFLIISGGVNIYPQEAENVLIEHPAVLDAAVIGVPHDDLGEEVRAVIQLVDPDSATDDLAAVLIAHCRSHIATFKCPRSVDFVAQLPRTEAGKLLKKQLRAEYLPSA